MHSPTKGTTCFGKFNTSVSSEILLLTPPGLKPRLPQSLVMFDNQYQALDKEKLKAYDHQMHEYYKTRSFNTPFTVRKVKGWTDHIEDHLERSKQPFMLSYLNKQGFAKNKPLLS